MNVIDQPIGWIIERSVSPFHESTLALSTVGGIIPKGMGAMASLALALTLCSCSSKDDTRLASIDDSSALLAAEQNMMTKILATDLHGITGITDDPQGVIAYHGLHSFHPADNYEDRAFIPWNGNDPYIVFEVKPGLSPFRYYGITVDENGKSRAVGATGIIDDETSNRTGAK